MSDKNYQFVSTDAGALTEKIIGMYEQITGKTVEPASPEKLFISWVASVLVQAYVSMNYIGNQNLPSRASGENLDALGDLLCAIPRPQAQSAVCTMRFNISAAQAFDIYIPAGTRITDAVRAQVWETTEEIIIASGETTVTALARCQTVGTAGNGYAIGQINSLIDIFPYYSSCSNITESGGGADTATDDEYRELIISAQDAFSTAGALDAYAYHAKKVSTEIADVKVVRPLKAIDTELAVVGLQAIMHNDSLLLESLVIDEAPYEDFIPNDIESVTYTDGMLVINFTPDGAFDGEISIPISVDCTKAGCIDIYAIMRDGTVAGQAVKDLILASCNEKEVRPLTDKVSVKDPQRVVCNIALTYYIDRSVSSSASDVAAIVNAAVDEYKEWQTARIGRDINPSKLISFIMQTGVVKRVDVISPVFTSLRDGSDHKTPQFATIGTTTLTNGGYEDD